MIKTLPLFYLLQLFQLIITTGSTTTSINICCPPSLLFNDNHECVPPSIHHDQEPPSFQLLKESLQSYSFITNLPNCGSEDVFVRISLSDLVSQVDNDYLDYVDTPAITDSGHFRYNEAYYSPQDFCLASSTNKSLTIRLCKPTCDEDIPCIQKCCLLNEVLQIQKSINNTLVQKCIPAAPVPWSPVVYDHQDRKLGEGDLIKRAHLALDDPGTWNTSECTLALYSFKGPTRVDFRILWNGNVMMRGMSIQWENVTGDYCIDGISEDGTFSGYENDTVVLHCLPNSRISKGPDYMLGKLYYYIFLISCFFLLLTILVYVAIWEKHTIHGFSLLSYFVSLLSMEVSLAASFLLSENSILRGNNLRISTSCVAVAVFAHFSYFWAFAWMSVVNFDLWCTFRNLKSTLTAGRGIKKYLKYFFFALSIPMLVVGVGLSLDLKYGDLMPYERLVILPDYGKRTCHMSNRDARLPYLFGPITVLLAINLFFFFTTIFALKRAQKDGSKMARRKGPTRRQSISLIAKLICVMGVFWVFEVISYFGWLEEDSGDVGRNAVSWYWVIFDLLNHLQGVLIFIIFVCKRDIIGSLRHKCSVLDKICRWLSQFCPCCATPRCGSRHVTTITMDSENEGRPLSKSMDTKSSKTGSDSSRGSDPQLGCEKRPLDNTIEAVTQV